MAGRGRREVGDRLSAGTGAAGEGGAQPAALLRAGSQLPWPGAGPHRSCRVTVSVPAEPRGPEAGRGHEKGRAQQGARGAGPRPSQSPARPRDAPPAGGRRPAIGGGPPSASPMGFRGGRRPALIGQQEF